MKYIIIALILSCFIGCENNPVIKPTENPIVKKIIDSPCYHIKVVEFGDDWHYAIHFTNDNWNTETALYEMFDISGYAYRVDVVWQVKIFTGKNSFYDAIAFAKKFTTYTDCIENNSRTYNAAIIKRKWYEDNVTIPKEKQVY